MQLNVARVTRGLAVVAIDAEVLVDCTDAWSVDGIGLGVMGSCLAGVDVELTVELL